MTIYFVTRHSGAKQWASHHSERGLLPLPIDRHVEHYDAEWTQPGDVVMGNLPLKDIAALQRRGGQFVALDLDVPPELRGQELTAAQMARLGARLTPFRVEALESRVVAPAPAGGAMPAPMAPGRSLTLMLVSDQLAPQLIGLDRQPTDAVWLVETRPMRAKANTLRNLVQGWRLPSGQAPECTIEPMEDGSLSALRQAALKLLLRAGNEHPGGIWLNATGGTKPMALAFTQAASEARTRGLTTRTYYVDTAKSVLDSFDGDDSAPLRCALNVRQLIECSGRRIIGSARASLLFAQQMGRQALHQRLLAQPEHFIGMLNQAAMQHEAASRSDHPPADGLLKIDTKLARELAARPDGSTTSLADLLLQAEVLREPARLGAESPALPLLRQSEVAYLNGGWLEAHVAHCLKGCGADDWEAGLVAEGDGKRNELDAVAAAGNQLLVIEVKTQNQHRRSKPGQAQDRAAEQAFYKLDSLGGSLARLFSKRWYVSARPLDRDDLARARNLNIQVFAPGAGALGAPIEALAGALQAWVKESKGAMLRSPGFRPSNAPLDRQRWGAKAKWLFAPDRPAR